MLHRLVTVLCLLLALGLAGCDDARKLVEDSREGLEVIEEIAGKLSEFSASLSENDFAKAREIGAKIDHMLSTRVLSWLVQILVTEETEGVDAAKRLIQTLKRSEAITESESAALALIEEYFENKGRQRTVDIVVLVGALLVENKYGHGAGGLLLRLRETYRNPQRDPGLQVTNAPTQAEVPTGDGVTPVGNAAGSEEDQNR